MSANMLKLVEKICSNQRLLDVVLQNRRSYSSATYEDGNGLNNDMKIL